MIINIFVIFGLLGNFILIIIKLKSKFKPLMLLELLLIVSDSILIIYYFILVIMDWKFYGNYIQFDIEWRKSFTCKALSFIASFSCLLSNFVLILITCERYTGIMFMRVGDKGNYNKVIFSSISLIIISICLSLIPSLIFEVFRQKIIQFTFPIKFFLRFSARII